MSGYSGIENDSTRDVFRMSMAPDPDRFKSSNNPFLDAIGNNREAVGTFAQMLSAAGGRGRDRGYPQSGGFGGYGGSRSNFAGSGQFMADLGGTEGYSSSSLFMPDGQGGWGGVGGSAGKRSTGQKLAAGAGGALSGAALGAAKGAPLGPHGVAIGAGLGFLSGFLG